MVQTMTLSDKIAQLQEFSNKLTKLKGPLRTQTKELKKILKNIINELNPENEESLVSLLEAGELQLELPITSENIADEAITTEKIVDEAITANKLQLNTGEITITGTNTQGTLITEYNSEDQIEPILLACYPTAHSDEATIGYVTKISQGTNESGDITITIELSAAPGADKSVTYTIHYLAATVIVISPDSLVPCEILHKYDLNQSSVR
jgi:hypothetical protein